MSQSGPPNNFYLGGGAYHGTGTISRNQAPGYCYDAAGNLLDQGSCPDPNPHAYQYDAENRITSANDTVYTYDPSGQRVAKNTTKYFYFGGLPVAELNNGAWSDYIYAGSKRIAVSTSNGPGDQNAVQATNTNYYHGDQLGSARMMTTGTIMTDGSTPLYAIYAPFGQLAEGDVSSHYKFTGKERDTETGLDYFGARYYASNMGRFMSPDWSATPAAIPFADPANPQSLNLYSYVTNNPLNRTDPNGHNWFQINGKWQWHQGDSYTYQGANGKDVTVTSKYTGLLVATANGTDKKTGATTYALTLYDQNKVVATGNGFSGGNGMAPVKDGNYMMRLDIRDAAPNSINPNSALGNPPPTFGIQLMQNIPAPGGGYYDVLGAYGPGRVRLNPTGGAKDDGDYFHGQTNGHMWTHGCLCYGADNRFINYMWNNMPHAPMPAAIDTPVDKP